MFIYVCHLSLNMMKFFRLEKIKEEKQHVTFPDEVDTPSDVPARVRFAR